MGEVFSRVEWPIYLLIGFIVVSLIMVLVGGFAKWLRYRIVWLHMAPLMIVPAFSFIPLAFPQYTADTVQYPAEKTSSMELVETRQAGSQSQVDGVARYYTTEQTADGSSHTVFVVKTPNGVEQHVVIDSKQVKVHQDLRQGQAPYAVKYQAVYTNSHVYREGETPLCLKGVSAGCKPNAVLNTSNENDNMYDLHVPAGAARGGDNSASNH